MLLRALATGEFRPIGATRARSVDVRVIAATNRPLNQMMLSGEFRHDLFFRLRHFHIEVPPLRARGDDWKLMMEACLQRLGRTYGATRRLSPRSEAALANYTWPGNVRQLIGIATSGYAMADDALIEPEDFAAHMEMNEAVNEAQSVQAADASEIFDDLIARNRDFWSTVYARFMNRDLNRREMKSFVRAGLQAAQGNYRRLIGLLKLPDSDYQRFMDFLRHHDLKP
jgi:DNA-binding NtrC family response regulator